MSWFDGILLTTEEVDRICCEENQNNLNDLTKLAFNKRLTDFTMYALGDRVEVICKTGDEEEGDYEEIPVPGVLVGIHFTTSEVRYDVAFPIAGSKLWMVMANVRTVMRRLSDGKMSEFLDREILERSVKRTLGASLSVVSDDKAPVDEKPSHLVFIITKGSKVHVPKSVELVSFADQDDMKITLSAIMGYMFEFRELSESAMHNLVAFLTSEHITDKPNNYTHGDISVSAILTSDPTGCIHYVDGKPAFIV